MKITKNDIGRRVILRNGQIKIIELFDENSNWPFRSGTFSWNAKGFYSVNKQEHESDIMRFEEEPVSPSLFSPSFSAENKKILLTKDDVGKLVELEDGTIETILAWVANDWHPVKGHLHSFTAEGILDVSYYGTNIINKIKSVSELPDKNIKSVLGYPNVVKLQTNSLPAEKKLTFEVGRIYKSKESSHHLILKIEQIGDDNPWCKYPIRALNLNTYKILLFTLQGRYQRHKPHQLDLIEEVGNFHDLYKFFIKNGEKNE
jgi:hypothetical protein